jgi:hypothetical protein
MRAALLSCATQPEAYPVTRPPKPPTDEQRERIAHLARLLHRKGVTAPKTHARARRLIRAMQNELAAKGKAPHRRKTGATRTRLTYTAAPSREIRAKQRKARRPSPVTVRHVEPDPRPRKVERSDAPPTPRQRKLLKALCRRAGQDVPYVSNRAEASEAIARVHEALDPPGVRRP